jgi:D-alanine-D-alanine ligase
MTKPSVVVLMGGPDAERGVSIHSGTAVTKALQTCGEYSVTSIVIDTVTTDDLRTMSADVFFPVLHGPYGEGGLLQQTLEETQIPFVGSGSSVSECAMHKIRTKEIAKSAGIQTPTWCEVTKEKPCTLVTPYILKPIDEGSSIDLAICKTPEEALRESNRLLSRRPTLLAESYIDGRELTVGIIDGIPLPIFEILPPEDLRTYDYSAKYERDDTIYLPDPFLPENDCVEQAMKLYELLGVRDIARVDFLLDACGSWMLELNTMPGFTDHSLVPMAADYAGMSMPTLCTKLVHCALRRKVK